MKTLLLSVGIVAFCAHLQTAVGQEFLNLQESPPSSGLLSAQKDSAYTATGFNNGVTWLVNAEAGDRATFAVTTTAFANSYPRIRVATSAGVSLAEVVGTLEGQVTLEGFQFQSPGVFKVTVFSNNSASAFSLQALLGRGVGLEIEDNNLATLASGIDFVSQSGGLAVAAAGIMDRDDDWHDLGTLDPGSSINFSLDAPAKSTLTAAGTELGLFKDADTTPLAIATGASLTYPVTQVGRYRIRARVPALQGRNLHFRGGSDRVNLGNPSTLQITGSQTIEFWIKPDDFTTRQNPYAKAYAGEGTITIETNGTVNYFYGTGGGNTNPYQTFTSATALKAGRWQHVALVRDLTASPAKLRWYFDGKLNAETNASYPAASVSTLDATIATGYAGALRGTMDEFRIWNVARTAAEISGNLDNPLVGNEPGLKAYLPFEEGSGATTAELVSVTTAPVNGTPLWEGSTAASVSAFVSQGLHATYLLRGTIADTVAPSVVALQPIPASGHLFNGTTQAPANMTALRGNNGQSYYYTVTGTTGGSIWGTDVYTDDSSIAKAAVHAGVLLPGEIGAVKVTIKPGLTNYYGSSRFGADSNGFGTYAGSYEIERYTPALPFTLSGLYPQLWVSFSEEIISASLASPGAITLVGAGADDTFGTLGDLQIALTLADFTDDRRAIFNLTNTVLTPGRYRFTVGTAVTDRAGNALAAPFVEEFIVAGVASYTNEDGDNATLATADSLGTGPTAANGSFLDRSRTTATAGWPFDVELADFNRDGKLDAAVSHLGSVDGLRFYPGLGTRAFGPPLIFDAIGDEPHDLELLDWDKDGDLDVAITAAGTDAVALFRNESVVGGTIAFTRLTDIPVGDEPLRLVVGDFNGDTFPDLACANRGTNATTGRCISILTNTQTGSFTETKIGQGLAPRLRTWGISAGDFNKDNKLDLVLGDMENGTRAAILLGNGDSSFGAPSFLAIPDGSQPSDIAVADFDQDGNPDFVACSQNAAFLSLFKGNGDGTFGPRINLDLGGYYAHFIRTADLDGDAFPDLLFSDYYHTNILLNRADGSLGFDNSRRTWYATYAAAVGDLDGDGAPEIVITDHDENLLRVLDGVASAKLAADDAATGVSHGYGRGFLTNGSDLDHWSFTASRGQLLTIAVDLTGFPGGNYLLWRVYDEVGTELTNFYNFSGGGTQGQSPPLTIPRNGTYFLRAENSSGYLGEYRFRVSLAPPGTQLESEDNNATNQSDPVTFALSGNQLSATVGGYLAGHDALGDYFALGNLASGTQVSVNLRLPTTSTLVPALTLFKSNGTAVVPSTLSPTQLIYTLQSGDESTYHLHIRDTSGRGLLAEYFADIVISDRVPPTILTDTLPVQGSSQTYVASSFTLSFSEDMLPVTVTPAANYQLLASGGDGTFSDGNEIPYAVVPAAYTSGLSNSYSLPDGPLQPDSYRFTVATNLRDKLDNNLTSAYVRNWTVVGVPGYVLEDRDNNTLATADPLGTGPAVANGSFLDRGRTTATAGWPFDVELADFNRDGKLDAAVSHLGSVDGLRFYPGLGTRAFGPPLIFDAIGDEPHDLELLDWDKDGDLDVAITAAGTDAVALFRNDSIVGGTIAFTRLTDIPVGDEPLRLVVGDFNGDTFPDLACANRGTNATTGRCVSILTNTQTGSFTETKIGQGLAPRLRTWGISAGDFNKDNKLDLVLGDMENGTRAAILLGNGDSSFGAPSFLAIPDNSQPSDIAVADFDQDGNPDFVACSQNAAFLSLFKGNGDGTFGPRINLDLGGYYAHFIRTADLDGDAFPDLLFSDYYHTNILLNRADGSLGFDNSRRTWYATYAAAVGDLDGDGAPEIVVTDHDENLLRVLDGVASAKLAADDAATGVSHGYGRGFLTNGSDLDHWSFTASRGQLLTIAVDLTGFPGGNYLLWRVYDEVGTELTNFYNFSGSGTQGQSPPLTIPRNGTYFLRAENSSGYLGEYRFRVSLAPPGTQLESEDNNATNQSDPVTFALSGNQLSATVGGYLAGYDALGDYFALGNLASGTQVSVSLRLPTTSTLVPALTLFKSNGTAVVPSTLSPTQLIYTLQSGDESTYHLHIRDTSGRGLLAEYFADIAISDIVAPLIVTDTLPVGSTSSMINAFSLTFNKDMLASTVNSPATYSLVWAGPDGGFASGDEVNFSITPAAYSAGLTNSYVIDNAPLQAGNYRFTVTTALRDKFGNLLPLPYQHDFNITQPQGFAIESEPNNTATGATQLVLDTTIPGYLTGNGRGVLVSSGDIEYWKFSANAGDRLVFETDLPFEPPSYLLNYNLTDPVGAAVFERNIGRDNLEQFAPTLLTKTGTYLLRIDDYYGVRTEHRFRVSLVRGTGYEVENNDTIGTASPMTFAPVNGIDTATTAGFVSTGGELDYLDLGTISAGNTVFLTVRRPAASTLGPIVSLYSDAGILQSEINGSPGDDSAEIQISTAGRYTALMRANFGTHGLNGDYVLDARILPTSSINFPNIRVTRLDEVTTPSLVTGDNFPLSYDVQNVGNLGTGGSGWVDRVVLSPNAVYGDGDDLQLALIPRNGALAAGQSYTINQSLALPQGLPGTFYLMVKTDSGNAVDETLQEGDNVTVTTNPFTVGLRPYPDLVIENVVVGAPDVAGNYTVNWNLANRGPAAVPAGQFTRVQVVNATNGQEVVNLNLAATSGLALNQTLAQSHTFNAVTPGFYQVTISADSTNVHYEFNTLGHGNAEQNAVQSNFQIFLFHQINVAASPAAGGSVTGGGQVRDGLQASVTAVANTSSLPYTFVNWTENGVFASGQTTYNFIANASRNLVAVFTLPQFLISAASSPPVGGSVSGAGSLPLGSTATLTANAAPGYLFNRWEENGATISSTSPLVFTVSAARSVTAVFTESNPTHVVSLVTEPVNLAVIPGAATYNNGGILDTTAPASVIVGNTEYVFQRFNLNGVLLGTQNHLVKTFTTADPANIVYTAVYTSRPLKPFVQSVVSNLGTTIPLATNTQFTVTFDRDMNIAVLANLTLTSPNAASIPAVPGGAWIDNRNWRSNPISFTAQNGGQFTLNVTLAADTNGRVMNPDASFSFTVDSLSNFAPLVISPAAGTYLAAVDVTISSTTSGATIYYTTDGSQPDTNSQVYGGAFQIGVDATVRAKAYKAGFHPSAVASAVYRIDAQPPVIGSFSWDGAPISNGETFIRKRLFSTVATDNLGIARAEFYYQPSGAARVLIGTDGNPGDGLTTPWNVAAISDGNYTVVARVYDVSGAWSETARNISVVLGLPAPPQITQPGNGVSIESPDIALQIQTEPETNVRIFRDNVYLFADYTSAAGVLNYTAPLPTGTSIFKAVAQNRAGSSPDSNAVSVTRVREFPQLALSFANNTVSEGATLTGTVTLPAAGTTDLLVQISLNKASQFNQIPAVVIPAGSLTGEFQLNAYQDTLIEVPTTMFVTAAAAEHRSAVGELFLADDDYPTITLGLAQASVSETHGNLTATVSRATATDRSLRVTLLNSLPAEVNVPAYVDIPANGTSVSFTLSVVNDAADDGNQTATLRGQVIISGTVLSETTDTTLEVRDDEGPLLALEIARPFLAEGASLSAVLRRAGASTADPLVVTFSQAPGAQVTLPPSATIPAGSAQTTVPVSALATALINGTRQVELRASAAGFTDGLTTLSISDQSMPELVVAGLSAPPSALTEQYAAVSYQIVNHGFVEATGPFLERAFLSKDPSLSGDDLLVRQIEFTGNLTAGGNFARNVTILAPREIGNYYLIVTVDPGGAVEELNETNNTTILTEPIQIRAAYSATVQTAPDVLPTNTPLTFTGTATRENGQPAAFSMVNIHIALGTSNRVISAVTNSIGQFSTVWTPLRNEGGLYTIGAVHPGTPGALPQDSFEILTLGFDGPGGIVMNEAETVVAQAVLRNPNSRPLTGVTMTVGALPAGLTIVPAVDEPTLDTGDEMVVPITISANAGFSGSGNFPLTVNTAEGVTMQASLSVSINLLKPVLTLDPSSLSSSVLRGVAKAESFTITNTGGLETGAIQILLPDLPWLSLASANPIPSIPPGGTASVSLNLSPDITVPLTLYTGNLALNPANGAGKSVPYRFRTVSDLRGDLEIEVVDELFFFTAETPRLAGARVTVRDAITSAEIETIVTGIDGLASFETLPEGWYRVEVNAPEHDNFSGNYYVNAGESNRHQIFTSKQLVKYSWKVEEVEIQDVYRVTVETTFETNVPAPVVTASPSNFDVADLVALGQSKTINVTLENHGFIAAQHSRFRFSDHPFYEFIPLVTNIGTIPAKSSLVVPVTIRRVGVFDDDGNIVTLRTRGAKLGQLTTKGPRAGSVPCGAGAAVDYDYPCGEWLIEKVVVMAVSGIQGNCGGSGGPSGGGGIGGYYGFLGGFYGGPGGGTTGASGSSLSYTSPDPCLPVCIARAIADCAIGFTPVGCFYSAAQCFNSPGFNDTCGWALAGCAGDLLGIGPIVNGANCIYSFAKCYSDFGGSGGGGGGSGGGPLGSRALRVEGNQFVLDDDFRDFAPDVAAAWEKLEPALEMFELYYGSKALVLAHGTPAGKAVMDTYGAATLAGSPGGTTINAVEATDILDLASGAELDAALVQRAIDRWNRTVDYYSRSIYEIADVPAGDSLDFVDNAARKAIAARLVIGYDASRAKGYIEPFQEFLAESAKLRETLLGEQGGTCAKVKIQLSQEVMMTRTAFRATLELENERETDAITGVGFDLEVRDSTGQPANDLFNIQVTNLVGLGAIDGTGEIPASGVGSVQFTLIPRDTAALQTNTAYTVGGVIHYTQGTTQFNIPVEKVPITVRPDASLDIKYFHQRDVISDDPHTDAIEPAQPYKLCVLVENNGYGQARNLKIISGQPQIVDNEKGLFIDFKIIGTEVDGQSLSPSLTADFGNVDPGGRKIATWLMTSTLQGLFTDYKATFEHVTGLGDSRISLLKNVEIHEMIRTVKAQAPGEDNAPDFLVNDVNDVNDFPDTIHYSDGGTDLVTLRQTGVFSGAPTLANPTITLSTGAFSGWSYIRLPDPANGAFRLVSVTRADGRVLPLDLNAWQSDRTFIGGGRRPRNERIIHLADQDSTGNYSLNYAPLAPADLEAPASIVTALPAQSQPDIPLFWSGTDNQGIASFDIYVSANGGAFTIWRTGTTALGGLYSGTPGETYAFYSRARDFAGNTEMKSPIIEASTTVSLTNVSPVISPIADQTIKEGEIFSIQASATDPDGTSGDIRFSLGSNLPGVFIHPVTGIISWNSSEFDGGTVLSVVVVATDGGVPPAVANEPFTITIADENSVPVISQVGPQSLQSTGLLIVDVDAVDGDSPTQQITFELTDAPAGAGINPSNGVVTWTPAPAQAGASHVFTVKAKDSGTPQKAALMSFAVNVVTPADRAPVFTGVPVVLWVKGTTYSLNVHASDPDGDPITLATNLTTTAGATFADQGGGTGQLAWNTTAANVGTYQVPVAATANGATTHATVSIRVEQDELYWNWAKESFGVLASSFNLALLDMNADPDGDGRGNIHEMTFLTNPVVQDTAPLSMTMEQEGPFSILNFKMHRRVGSERYVQLGLAGSTNMLGAWEPIPPTEWFAAVDVDGDDDSRPESESVEFQLYEYHPGGLPKGHFYRVQSSVLPGTP